MERWKIDEVGPVERELARHGRIDGLVFGAYGEVSQDVETLVHAIVKNGAIRHWRHMGADSVMEARAVYANMTRRALGITAVKRMRR